MNGQVKAWLTAVLVPAFLGALQATYHAYADGNLSAHDIESAVQFFLGALLTALFVKRPSDAAKP